MASVTALYGALFGLLCVGLSVRVIRARRAARVAIGAGDDTGLLRAIRAHGNFAEYVPLALVLMLLAELGGASAWLLHVIGLTLLAGRLVHALGVSRTDEDYRYRVAGMAATFGAIAVLALLCIASAVAGA